MLSHFFITRPRFAFVIAILMTLVGGIALMYMPKSQYPEITPKVVSVTAVYPGANAETIQQTVIEPLESKINGVKDMMYVSSTASDDGTATINVTFPVETDGDINTVNVQNRVARATAQLPDAVKLQGVITQEQSTSFLLVVTLYSPNKTYNSLFLSNYLNIYVNDEVVRIAGVGNTAVFGASAYAMRVWLDRDKMASLDLDASDIVTAIREQNVQAAAGAVGDMPIHKEQEFRYTVQTQGRLSEPSEFEQIVVRSELDGSQILLRDVATVELGGENYNYTSRLYSQTNPDSSTPTALLAVFQLPDGNALDIAAKCREKLEELSKSFPPDVEYDIHYDSTKFVNASIHEVVETLLIAVLLVVLVTFLFLQNWRATLVPTLAIPVSLVGTFAVLLALGYSINLISLFALILAIGIVVDDAIVVVENVFRLMEEENLSPVEATKKSMIQVTGPIVATTLVLLAMFIPVCFLGGITGEIYRQFGITISVSVLISAINALTLSPALCATILKSGAKTKSDFILFRGFNAMFNWITRGYSKLVSGLVRKAFLVLFFYLLLSVFAMDMYTWIPTGFIPQEDQGAFFVELQLPDAASFHRTDAVADKVARQLVRLPGVTDVLTISGRSLINSNSTSNSAFVIGILDDFENRTTQQTSQATILAEAQMIAMKTKEGAMMSFPVPTISGLGVVGGFTFVVEDRTGTNPARLEEAVRLILERVNTGEYPALLPNSVRSTFRANVPQIYANIDREKAKKLGVAISSINNALQSIQGYSYINDINKFGKTYKVEIQGTADYRQNTEQLEQTYVRSEHGAMVPLSTLVDITTQFGPTMLRRYNLYSSVQLLGDAAPGYSSGDAMKTMEEIANDVLPEGMGYEWTDMSYQERLAGSQTAIVFALALIFIYFFLVAQYESWMIPLAVMLAVPVALLGSVLFLFYLGIDNNIYVQVGFVLLFGLASKTAILIVEFAREHHLKTGTPVIECAIYAAKLRFRAVLMTGISFILGVFPLVIASGASSASRQSLGAVVFGGMLISCIFGTILVPVFFTAIQKLINRSAGRNPEEASAVVES